MALYTLANKQLKEIKEIKENPFKLERDIQTLVEANLPELMGLKFVHSEFSHAGLRVDTLAFDEMASAFVVIEFKRGSNYSVVDQGMSYLGLMLNNKAEFVLAYNERFKAAKKKDDIDWSQSRVVFISPFFTTYQREALNFKDLPIEIWEIHRYSNNTIRFDQLQHTAAIASFKTISKKSPVVDAITKEVVTYTEDYHLKRGSAQTVELYNRFKELVLSINPSITIKPLKLYIAFRMKTNVTDVIIQKRALKIFINLSIGELDDPKKLAQDVSKIGHWASGDYQIIIDSDKYLEYVASLVKQSYLANS